MYINIKVQINMVIVKTAYKFRAYPSIKQKEILNRQMYLSKEVYNLLLDKSKAYYKETKRTLTEYRMNVWLTQLKKERLEFNELHSQVLQNVSKRISDAYKSFFRRYKEKKAGKNQKVGFPRYRNFVSSLTYPQTNGFKVEKKKISLSKIGAINFVNHREIEGKAKTCIIKKTKSGEWYITIATEKENIVPFTNGKEAVGIDLGLTNYATLSNGVVLDNKKIPRTRLKRLRRIISRKKKGSRNRRKAVIRFAREYEYLTRVKEDYLHKLSFGLVNSYSFIAYEDLKIQNMMGSHHLARAIGEASWGNFADYLQYKAESAGCAAVGVNPRDTSKTCSDCGNVQEIALSERTFNCKRCGMSKDRDLNASINILKRATEGQSGSHASGDGVRPSHMKAVIEERGTTFGVSR
jgi:putative transposase